MLWLNVKFLHWKLQSNSSPIQLNLKKYSFLLEKLDETHKDAATTNEVHKHQFKAQCDKLVKPREFLEGGLVLVYAQKNDTLGARKIFSMLLGTYNVKVS